MKPEVSRAVLEAPGPWVHRRISASGASFHIADAGPEDASFAVILLHSFPMTWWTWREVIPAFTQAGIRTIAMDLRGFGTSDLAPGEVELTQLATDVAGVASALGISSYTVVGNGMGGVVAWMLGALKPAGLQAIVPVCAPHPLGLHFLRGLSSRGRGRWFSTLLSRRPRVTFFASRSAWIDRSISQWAAPFNREEMLENAEVYREALSRHIAVRSAWESLRATFRPSFSSKNVLTRSVTVPVLSIQARDDGLWSHVDFADDVQATSGEFTMRAIGECGHFPQEENPQALIQAILPFIKETAHYAAESQL